MNNPMFPCRIRDYTNFSLFHHRHLDGHLVSMHQSGSNWVKHLLAMVLAKEFGLPEPDNIHDNRIVTHPNSPTPYAGIPKLAQSHNIPSPLLAPLAQAGMIKLPPVILLVRDMRNVLESHYAKLASLYRVPFSEFLRAEPASKRYDKDIWWDIRFLNCWHALLQRVPQRICLVRYETLRASPLEEMRRILGFVGLSAVSDETIRYAIEASSKEAMKAKDKSADGYEVVRISSEAPLSRYSEEDKAYFKEICARYLHHDFGYRYQDW